ncbi:MULTISPECIES: nucleotide exchange factor GrpE [Fictibacillus]|uniref:Protein GrpE n=1 Tax=Fictibacillus enclensis TaxID=1017270 RepID=A0A0V8JFW5_9BACL|nr:MULTISPECIES: nucleotide exchange factor GrpE [Fictibacillus]KSU85817.1 molecular chaperone GrpE [Fictibacillus enclensis]RXY98466.1 nucleotide exchange factor GrpE [Fictibacillus sp. S7]SCC03161.1 molecular chaperone GrpE [Fictibacillus enclensis]
MENNHKDTAEFEEMNDTLQEEAAEAEQHEVPNAQGDEDQAAESSEPVVEDSRIAQLEASLADTENRLLRVQADFENFKRRTREDQAAQLKYKSQSLITQLLPALDNFERAMDVKVEDAQAASVLQGVEMVYRQLLEAVKSEGLEVIETEGAAFDPNLHQAVMQVQDEEYESNVIVETLQKGYKLKDRVIRPAMVKVNQ